MQEETFVGNFYKDPYVFFPKLLRKRFFFRAEVVSDFGLHLRLNHKIFSLIIYLQMNQRLRFSSFLLCVCVLRVVNSSIFQFSTFKSLRVSTFWPNSECHNFLRLLFTEFLGNIFVFNHRDLFSVRGKVGEISSNDISVFIFFFLLLTFSQEVIHGLKIYI